MARDYKQEWKTAKARGEGEDNATRHRARYKMQKDGKVAPNDGQDVGHKLAIKRGGTNTPANLSVQPKTANRSFSRNPDGSMKSETSKKERR
ncbi:HNH endonuclease [bacterium]|nr:HNH endonuclease [bacterium]